MGLQRMNYWWPHHKEMADSPMPTVSALKSSIMAACTANKEAVVSQGDTDTISLASKTVLKNLKVYFFKLPTERRTYFYLLSKITICFNFLRKIQNFELHSI